ncbi:innexin inx7 [Pectinophora gossypiella]|uniref:Innexin n=2 Tax=Pectinophora gossypiella TaxID=13191 RepID=A0A1E1W3D1_PECGO|nr:innexin inx7 [Pectinophora gossypiella]XP_049887981.1 innexin inx7 [Pectinophora gossypiella]XP_049887982.1 innexin inx7 [Pectinophora gossypiella]XP_049887983.1 innexin inx7 [Pectinophora gossypiella]
MLVSTINTLIPRVRFKLYRPTIENFVFQLHYKATVTILLAFVILVCAREYFGDHIKCISDQGVPNHVIQTYCFFMATFTVVRHYNESLLQAGFLPHPGVGPMSDSDETLHHTYYQWVPFVLFLQSICFYLPHYIWKKKEGGRIKALVEGLQYASLALEDQDMTVNGTTVPSKLSLENRLNTIRKDIILRLRISRTWSTWLVAMEVVNLLHVMLQIWLINIFLNGNFLCLGPWVMSVQNWNNIADPLETVFPKVTKCLFHKYGPSGSIQQHDALCVMALNIIHEKIYTVLWFWLLFLFIASLLAVIWRVVSYFVYRRSTRFTEMMFRQVAGSKFSPTNVIRVVNGCQFADWLFLYYLSKNMQGFVFQELFIRLAEELEKRDMPFKQEGYEEKGAEPVLLSRMDYDDETLPLKDEKKAS